MSQVKIQGDPSGTGIFTIASPNSNSNYTLTLPETSGTLLSASGGALPVSQGGTGATSQTAYAVICGGTTSTGAYQSIAGVGSAGQVLTSNGAGALPTFQAAGGGFAAGTRLIFAQDAAPTGWTKDTTNYNNHALRVVTGTAGTTGGSVDFTTAFASQTPSGSVSVNVSGLSAAATTLTSSQIPSHNHSVNNGGAGVNFDGFSIGCSGYYVYRSGNTGSTGGGGSHTHSISGSATGSFTGNAINLAVKYLNVITATKD